MKYLLKPLLLEMKSTGESTKEQEESTNIEVDALKKHINILSDQSFEGRRTGTRGEAEACRYLAEQLKLMGIGPAGEQGAYFQSFPIPNVDLKWKGERTVFSYLNNSSGLVGENILGLIESKKNNAKYIVISAHLDHLGTWKGNLYPGANDNASGVATVLEMARILNIKKDKLPCSILIAFWSGEEMGTIGSRFFVRHMQFPAKDILYNINLDSIGSGNDNNFIYWAKDINVKPEWGFDAKLNNKEFNLKYQVDVGHSSDHKAFLEKNIPALTILAENWLDNNHSPQDTGEGVNYSKMALLGHFLIDQLYSKKLDEILS
ncbi:MAG: M20/M25/M40 family metallo-hydrolase [Clostridia bacterium]|nr:M20/M25/M40 family metallo-hydrolase [Clostridia bacterium]